MEENKVKLYQKWWFWLCIVLIVCVVGGVIILTSSKNNPTSTTYTNNTILRNRPSKENIIIEKLAVTHKDTFVFNIKNNNNSKVVIDEISIILKDENGNFVKKVDCMDSNIPLDAGQETISYFWNDDELDNFENYSNYEFTFEINDTTSSYYINNNFEINSNDNGKQLAVTIKNNNKDDVMVLFNVLYYKDNKIIGFSGLNITDVISGNSQGYINIDYPYDENGKTLKFDNYKLYLVKAKIQ